MLKNLAAVLVAASVFAAPALAQNPTPAGGSKAPAAQAAAPAKTVAPSKAASTRSVKHVKKHKRHVAHVRGKHSKVAHVAKVNGKALGQASKSRTLPARGIQG
jgi:hypothetical protein